MTEETFFKIRRRQDGLFSTGGHTPRFSSKGKVWYGTGPLRSHINTVITSAYGQRIYDGCEIVRFVAKELEAKPVSEEITAAQERSAKRKAEREQSWQNAKVKEEMQKLRELQAKYPDIKQG